MIIRNAIIHDAIHAEPRRGDLLIENGKLVSVGGTAEGTHEILDASGLHAYPGFVDAHSHIGLDGYGGPTGMTYDYNEKNDICTLCNFQSLFLVGSHLLLILLWPWRGA